MHCEAYLSLGGLDEALVEVVGAHRVRQLAEVHLEQGGHAVDVLIEDDDLIKLWSSILQGDQASPVSQPG